MSDVAKIRKNAKVRERRKSIKQYNIFITILDGSNRIIRGNKSKANLNVVFIFQWLKDTSLEYPEYFHITKN